LRGIFAADKAEDAGGLTPARNDNAVYRKKTHKDIDYLVGYSYKADKRKDFPAV
jgi:hypothetical protein